jgi:hypothetical protein
MTTPFALGAVSAVLRSRLTLSLAASGVSASVGGVKVTALPPDRITTGPQEQNRLNVFLHHVTRNPGWANLGPPPRNGGGELVASLPLAVDLHYVVSAYGQDPLTPEILLGHAVAAFNDEPTLTRAIIRRALAPAPPDPTIPAEVSSSRLADQFESVKVTASNPGVEEVTRMWAAFMAPYRPSAYYDVSVVLIESTQPARVAFPVSAVGGQAIGVARPVIESIAADGPPGTPLTSAATLVISGSGLAAPSMAVRAGPSVATPASATDSELKVPVSSFVPPLQAGLRGLTVTHHVDLGNPPTPHPAATSDAFALALRPALSFAAGAVALTSTVTVDGVAFATGKIAATVAPAVGREQQVLLLLTEAAAPADRPARGATLAPPAANGVPPGADDTTAIAFPFAGIPTGKYVARIVVDGVQSVLHQGADGRYDAPAVTI